MDFLGVNKKRNKQSRRTKKGIKVVYISSPMKVETCASKFRALVQELTGKDSDAAKFMDVNGGENSTGHAFDHGRTTDQEQDAIVPNNNSYSYESSPSADSDSIFDSFDKYLTTSMEGSFMSMFQPNFSHEYPQLDVFN